MSNLDYSKIKNCRNIESGHTKSIRHIIFYNNDQNFITGSDDGNIKFFDRQSGECLKTLSSFSQSNKIYSMLLMTNGVLITGHQRKILNFGYLGTKDIKSIKSAH